MNVLEGNKMENKITSKPIENCQICNNPNLDRILFLGYIPPVNEMPTIGSTPVEQKAYPLELLRCSRCTLVQIGLEVAPDVLFPPTYPYVSGSTKILRDNFAELYRECNKLLQLKSTDLIVDIGSNDGTLLSNFKQGGHRILGIEPSLSSQIANSKGINTIITFFNSRLASEIKEKHGTAKVITAANVFAHIGDIRSIVDCIVNLLNNDGVFVSESHYLLSLVQTLQYDTIYHEHLRYYSLKSLSNLLDMHGLEVFNAKKIPTHGGSIRVYAARKGQREVSDSVEQILELEAEAGITDGSALKTFRERVMQSKIDLYSVLKPLKEAGARIYGISAPSRASTLINYTGLDDGILDYVVEIKSSPKVGKYIPGKRISVLDEIKLFEDQPEYALLLSWHIADELVSNLRKKGYAGKFIVPLPQPKII